MVVSQDSLLGFHLDFLIFLVMSSLIDCKTLDNFVASEVEVGREIVLSVSLEHDI